MSLSPEWFKARFQAELPEGFDDKTILTFIPRPDLGRNENDVIITHPAFPPHRLNRQKKVFEKIIP